MHRLRTSLTFLLATFAIGACADPADDASEDELREPLAQAAAPQVRLRGTGCSSSDSTQVSADGLRVTALLPRLKTPSQGTSASSNCEITYVPNIPAGAGIAISEIIVEGDTALQGGTSAKVTVSNWASSPAESDSDTTPFTGPKTNRFIVRSDLYDHVTPCSGLRSVTGKVLLSVNRAGGQRGTIGGDTKVTLVVKKIRC